MKKHFVTAFLTGVLSVVPAAGFAMTPATAQTAAPAKQTSAPMAATHATRGVVKSIDATSLVITRSGANHGEMKFALNSSTHREGTIAAGKPVSVRYREEGKMNVATAIRAQSSK